MPVDLSCRFFSEGESNSGHFICLTTLKKFSPPIFAILKTQSEVEGYKSGIATAVVLGVGRAIGEAMAVMMVSGNVANMPKLFESVRFLTTAVSSGMGYADGLYREALFSIALVLFLFIMLINATLNFFLKGEKK